MLDDLFNQGLRNIEDARYVRDHIIPVAVTQERWNIVVYEAQRATELLVRGLICQVGFKPPEHHDISGHMTFLYERLPGARNAIIPFTIGAYTEKQEGYGIILKEDEANRITLFGLNHSIRTTLAVCTTDHLPKEGQVNLRLELNYSEVTVYLNDLLVLEYTDTSHNRHYGPYKIIDRSFIRRPHAEKIRLLKKLGKSLTKDRNVAYYSERIYMKDDALRAISNMHDSFETTKAFFSFE